MEDFGGLFMATVSQDSNDTKTSNEKDKNDDNEVGFAAGTRLLYKTFCGININPNGTVFGLDSDSTDS